ncbi:hypothetical protein BCR36DRAFT_412948 [Piromyces finnis]|uniref:Uncharacterized protein n=1 Tax=Piromyces finnis TaxID=1754191 RepID=A0A1Y1V799_9FUNG|nr:hypothetical protein BCR36DRAFT_412948 [Piromyces finnis]|eukprot:ORX48939.1 hypothetical protein BCR36DRAFT_412948 [Piromyces finnis]
MKFLIKALLLVISIAEINGRAIKLTQKCEAALENLKNDEKFFNCEKAILNEDVSTACSYCTKLSFTKEVETYCSSNPNDKFMLDESEKGIEIINESFKKLCKYPSEFKESLKEYNSSIKNDSYDYSTYTNTTVNGSPDNTATTNLNNVIPENNNTNAQSNTNNSDATSSSSKLSYSLVTAFVLVAFNFLL